MDAILIRGLKLQARVGVGEEERARPQEIVVDVEVQTDLVTAASSDELGDTIDYHSVVERVSQLVEGSESRLLEHLAGKIVAEISTTQRVRRVSVEVAKVSPPIDRDIDAVAVRIEREVP